MFHDGEEKAKEYIKKELEKLDKKDEPTLTYNNRTIAKAHAEYSKLKRYLAKTGKAPSAEEFRLLQVYKEALDIDGIADR